MLSADLAVTTASGVPYAFSIGLGGAVSYQSTRPTNDPTHPTTPTGSIELAGLQAGSIAAYTGADGLPTVVAMTGPESFVYVNHYAPTGNAAEPLAWTGWESLGNFVATSITAADNAVSGPAIFAVGADHALYADLELTSATATVPSLRTGFDLIGGFNTGAVKARADGNGFAVFALQGAESYVYEANTSFTPAPGGARGGVVTATPWQPVDQFVATAIDASQGFGTAATNPNGSGAVVLYGLGADGFVHDDELVKDAATGRRVGTGLHLVGSVGFGFTAATYSVAAFSVVVTPTAATVFVQSSANSAVYALEDLTPSVPNSWGPYQLISGLNPTSIAATVGLDGNPSLYGLGNPTLINEVGIEEGLYLSQVAYTTYLAFDPVFNTGSGIHPGVTAIGEYVLGEFKPLAPAPTHALTTATGVNSLPVVFALGGDGSVSVNMDVAQGVPGAIDTYSGFSKLAGVSATSIAATAEPQGVAVFALTGPLGFIFENQYRPTGNAVTPYAWSGWSQVGNFTATSIAAVLPNFPLYPDGAGGSVQPGTPVLLARGATGLLYTMTSTAPTTSTGVFTFGGPTPLPGLSPATFSVKATNTGAEVFAQAGPTGYAYANLLVPTGGRLNEIGAWTGWQSLGDYVVQDIVAGTGSGAVPALLAEDARGVEVMDEYRSNGLTNTPPAWTGFRQIGFGPGGTPAAVASFSDFTGDGGSVFLLPNQPGGTLQAAKFVSNFYNSAEAYLTPFAIDASYGTPSFLPSSFAVAAGAGGSPSIFATAADGRVYVNQAVATGKFADPYHWTSFVLLGRVPT